MPVRPSGAGSGERVPVPALRAIGEAGVAGKGGEVKRSIVFLDIDGVLVNRRSLRERSGSKAVADPACVQALNDIAVPTESCIVLSSSWRFCGLEEMRRILQYWGVWSSPIGMTPDLTTQEPSGIYVAAPRHREIRQWMEENGTPERFVILDDDRDAEIEGHFVRTVFERGLTQEDVAKAIEILTKETK